MGSMGFEIAIILVLIMANGIFAMTEIAIVSSKKVRLQYLAEKGGSGAKMALKLANEPTRLLSTIQVGISIIATFTGAFGGATLAGALGESLKKIPALAPYSGAISLAIVVIAITYLSLIIGELVPKRIALNNPEMVATKVAVPINFFAKIVSPVVKILSLTTELVLRLLGIKEKDEEPITEEEINLMIAQGTKTGAFEKAEQDMIENVFSLADLRVKSLLTPRTQIEWLDLEKSDKENWNVLVESKHSRFPVGRGSLDEVVGLVYAKDILAKKASQGLDTLELEGIMREPFFVPKSMKAFSLLEMFKKMGTEIAFVIDEYGSLQGLVTIDDVVEEIVGDIPLSWEEDEEEIIQRDQNSWLLDGLLSIEEVKELFELDELPGEASGLFQTLAGFIMSYLGYIPNTGEHFEWQSLRFEIVDMDRTRIDKVLVTKL